MTSSGSTSAAKGVTSALSEALGIGQAAREYASIADTGRVPPGLRLNGTYSGQSGFTVEFHVDIAVVRCGEVTIAHPYMVAARPGGKIQSKPEWANRPNCSEWTRRETTDDNAHKVTYASKSANCAVGVLTPRR